MRKKQQKDCYMCGKPAECRDHVPPQGIFPDPKPTDLITVPSCKQCNEGSKLDDEYFRWFVATGSSEDPEATRLIKERIIKRFRERPALLKTIMKGAVKVNTYSRGGIFLKQRPGFYFGRQRPRIQRIIEKITKGLFRHEKGYRLGDRYFVEDFSLNPDISDTEIEKIISLPLKEIGGRVFSYRYAQCSEDDEITMWFLLFFNQMLIMTMTDVK